MTDITMYLNYSKVNNYIKNIGPIQPNQPIGTQTDPVQMRTSHLRKFIFRDNLSHLRTT